MLFGMRHGINKLEIEYSKLFEHLQSLFGYLPRSDNNDLPLCSSLFISWYYSTPFKRSKEKINDDHDDVEEVHLPIKKQRIEKEHFSPPPLPSSSSSSSSCSSSSTIKHPLNLTSIHKDVGPEGKRRWRDLIKIPVIIPTQKEKWRNGLYDEHHLDSDILKSDPVYNMNDFKKLEVEIDKMMEAKKKLLLLLFLLFLIPTSFLLLHLLLLSLLLLFQDVLLLVLLLVLILLLVLLQFRI
jgi:hypothetical protein